MGFCKKKWRWLFIGAGAGDKINGTGAGSATQDPTRDNTIA